MTSQHLVCSSADEVLSVLSYQSYKGGWECTLWESSREPQKCGAAEKGTVMADTGQKNKPKQNNYKIVNN